MAKTNIFMGIVLFGAIGWSGLHSSGGVDTRAKVLRIAKAEVGVKEQTGKNDGKRIAEYLLYTGIKIPAAWCASYISWCFGKAGLDQPKTAWSPSMFPASRIVTDPRPADVFGIWFPELKRIAHVGLIAEVRGEWLLSYEGNSNNNGGRNGNGVYARVRHKKTIYRYANWFK